MQVGTRIIPLISKVRWEPPSCEECGSIMRCVVSFQNGPDWPDDLYDYRTVENWTCQCGHHIPFPKPKG